jgi:MFS family permease
LGVKGEVSANIAVAVNYAGLTVGDFISGTLSQILKSRKKAILIFLFLLILFLVLYYSSRGVSLQTFYFLCFLIGVGAGYWVVFITTAAENFGTNLRATVATITPNFIRFSVVHITSAFLELKPRFGMIGSAAVIGVICFAIAFISWYLLEETYGKDLDFIEE